MDVSKAVAETVVDQQPRCYFLELPAEIRMAIYELILVSPDSSLKAHNLLELIGRIHAADQYPRIRGIDSKILATCSKVLYEAAPVLYGKNTFHFSDPESIKDFEGGNSGLFSSQPFTFTETLDPHAGHIRSYGRLQLLRRIHLQIDQTHSGYRFSRLSGAKSQKEARDDIWDEWKSFFNTRDSYYYKNLRFAALETLVLDFMTWQLTDHDKIMVNHIVQKLKTTRTFLRSIAPFPALTVGFCHRRTLSANSEGDV